MVVGGLLKQKIFSQKQRNFLFFIIILTMSHRWTRVIALVKSAMEESY